MMHYFCALNTLQYKKKIALLEPLLGYMQAQVNTDCTVFWIITVLKTLC